MQTPDLQPDEPVNIGRVLQGAAVFNFARHASRESFMDASNISREAEEFFDLLEARQVSFLLVGGLAMLAHVRGRNTEDVDLIISVPDRRRLEPEVAVTEPGGPGQPFAVGRYKQLRIDYRDAAEPFFKLVAERYGERRRFDFLAGGRPLACATPEGLMLLKLYALPHVTRQGDWERVDAYETDILNLWMMRPDLDPHNLLSVLRPFVWEGGLYSLEHEVLPDVARRKARRERRTAPPTGDEPGTPS